MVCRATGCVPPDGASAAIRLKGAQTKIARRDTDLVSRRAISIRAADRSAAIRSRFDGSRLARGDRPGALLDLTGEDVADHRQREQMSHDQRQRAILV